MYVSGSRTAASQVCASSSEMQHAMQLISAAAFIRRTAAVSTEHSYKITTAIDSWKFLIVLLEAYYSHIPPFSASCFVDPLS